MSSHDITLDITMNCPACIHLMNACTDSTDTDTDTNTDTVIHTGIVQIQMVQIKKDMHMHIYTDNG